MSKNAEVIIIGRGVIGCAAAYYLVKQGVSVDIDSFLIRLRQIGELDEPVGFPHGLVIVDGM